MARSATRKAAIKRGLSDADLRPLSVLAFTALCLEMAAENRRARRFTSYHRWNLQVARQARLTAGTPLAFMEG